MDETSATSRYWCHMCSQTVDPVTEIDTVKCPICQSGFVEEMQSESSQEENGAPVPLDPVRALSLWAPILLGMMGNARRPRQIEPLGPDNEIDRAETLAFDRELESIFQRRRRNSATILRLLRDMRAGLLSSSSSPQPGNNYSEESGENEGIRDRERMILINPFNQTIIVQGSYDHPSNNNGREPFGSLGDYFVGPGLDLLLQHLSENDPNRYGTPPARKEAVEALLDVRVEEAEEEEGLHCSICLDECGVGAEVKEMPCKHKFHGECILPWLELHSSCPVCRYQLPFDESKVNNAHAVGNNNNNTNNSNTNNNGDGGDDGNEIRRQFSVPLPWPFSGLFSSAAAAAASGSQSVGGDSSVNPRDAQASDGTSALENET